MEFLKIFLLINILTLVELFQRLYKVHNQLINEDCEKSKEDGVTLATECVLICQRKSAIASFYKNQCICLRSECIRNNSLSASFQQSNLYKEVFIPLTGKSTNRVWEVTILLSKISTLTVEQGSMNIEGETTKLFFCYRALG